MTKPVARLGISIDSASWNTLLEIDNLGSVTPRTFAIETAEATVWLYYAGDDDAAISRLVDLRGDLPCKSGGEVRDWAEASSAYFRAALRRARAERLLQSSREGSEKYVDADRERAKAIQELNETLRRFETAVERDAANVVEYEQWEVENRERVRFFRNWDHSGT